MGEGGETRTEKFNQLVRAIVVLSLVGGFLYGFIVSKVVNTESFSLVLGIAITWWFKSRDEQQQEKKNGAPPAPPPLAS